MRSNLNIMVGLKGEMAKIQHSADPHLRDTCTPVPFAPRDKTNKQNQKHKNQDHSVLLWTPKYENLSLSCRLLTPPQKHLSPYLLQCWYLEICLSFVSTKIMPKNKYFPTTHGLTVNSDICSFLSIRHIFFLNEPVFPKPGLPYKPL